VTAVVDVPAVLLEYQQELLGLTASQKVTVVEKSRRIGATWAVAADAVLCSSQSRSKGGMNVFYLGFNKDMTREFIDECARWAKEFLRVAVEVQEFMFKDQGDGGEDKDIQAFRIVFASGCSITALCSRPRSLRGRQGYVIIDEAAFHDELAELLKAALALLIWGGKVLIISTHDGVDNPFNQLVEDCRAGRKKYALMRCTFQDAVDQGLYKRVCLRTGQPWSKEAEDAWVAEIRGYYGDGADEELDCIPRQSGGRYLARTLLEGRVTDAPVLRWSLPDDFVDRGEDQRYQDCVDWCTDNVLPLLQTVPAGCRTALGEDFGRSGDLTVLWPLAIEADLRRVTPFVIELRNVPFRQQEQVLFFLVDNLPRCEGIALDARGNGQYLAEVTRQRYGAERVAEVMLTEGWYRENMPRLKAALEDDSFRLPRDADIVDDFHHLEMVRGVARPPEKARQAATGQRHSDAAVAGAMALFASSEIESPTIEFSVAGAFVSNETFGGAIPRYPGN
jgi:phage FluMu gp28-like protein